MTKKLFRTLKITCLCMALTAALPIVSFADETTAAVKEDKMVVRIIHLDENGNLLEEDKQTATEETESSEDELPHSSGGQSRMGRQVSSSEMRPGDIICYGSGKRINHVALYIGNGQIVHASTERTGIKVSRWNYRTPVRIVNVLGD